MSANRKFASSLVRSADPESAIDNAIADIQSAISGPPDLTFVFVSQFDPEAVSQIHQRLNEALKPTVLLGCTAESVVGVDSEVEMEPAVSVWSATLPGTRLHPFHLTFENTPDGGTILGWPDAMDEWPDAASMILLPEPFTFPTDYLLERLKDDRPQTRIIGGVASGGTMEGQNRLLLNDKLHSTGCAGLLIDGGVTLDTIVSQGCRPIGKPMIVTKAERNIIIELGGKPAYDQLAE
ncbi:FIST N-terminal domain-containing protein, partial [Planctomycetota bacterium]